jgi:uncharacterized protein (TIGR01319 family)
VPIVVAGNRTAAPEACDILRRAGKEVRRADNVMPTAGALLAEPAREEIRNLFMQHITRAKGLDALRDVIPVVLPTPAAVLQGIRIGAVGTPGRNGWGEMLVVDVGGATTDVHSIGYGHPTGENVVVRGIAEAYAKRTVEGDLGIRFNAATILSRIGLERLAADLRHDFPELSAPSEELHDYIQQISEKTSLVPQQPWHQAADAVLARNAVESAIARHVGRRERIIAHGGEAWVHWGKDLRDVRTLIGTGGVFVHNRFASYILSAGERARDRVEVLRPKRPNKFVDASYVLYASGLLAERYPEVAQKMFDAYLRPL